MLRRWADHALADVHPLALGELEYQGVADVLLLDRRLADEELAGLAVMVREAARPLLDLAAVLLGLEVAIAGCRALARAAQLLGS
jgi:hypothetical protein